MVTLLEFNGERLQPEAAEEPALEEFWPAVARGLGAHLEEGHILLRGLVALVKQLHDELDVLRFCAHLYSPGQERQWLGSLPEAPCGFS